MTSFPYRKAGVWTRLGELFGVGSLTVAARRYENSIAALLFALEALRETGIESAFNVENSFTADEERGQLGAGWFVAKGLLCADAVINCKGGSGLTVGYGHNGFL